MTIPVHHRRDYLLRQRAYLREHRRHILRTLRLEEQLDQWIEAFEEVGGLEALVAGEED